MSTGANASGKKFDAGKLPLHLIPRELFDGVAEVLAYGAKKYDAHNWRGGIAWSRVYSAVLRHLVKWNGGEDCDSESGINHLCHAACGLAFLLTYLRTHPALDDRYVPASSMDASRIEKSSRRAKTDRPGSANRND